MPRFDDKIFFDKARVRPFGGQITQQQVDGTMDLLEAWFRYAPDPSRMDYLADILAQVYHESATMMIPVTEGSRPGKLLSYAQSVDYVKRQGYRYAKLEGGFVWPGMGRIQNTWFDNAKKWEKRLGLPFTRNPTLYLDSKIDAKLTVIGFHEGLWRQGKKLSRYLDPPPRTMDGLRLAVLRSRDIINGDMGKVGPKIVRHFEDFYVACRAAYKPEEQEMNPRFLPELLATVVTTAVKEAAKREDVPIHHTRADEAAAAVVQEVVLNPATEQIVERIQTANRLEEVTKPKPKTQSVTLWGIGIAAVLGIGSKFFPEWLPEGSIEVWTEVLMEVGAAVGLIIATAGRLRATRPLTNQSED